MSFEEVDQCIARGDHAAALKLAREMHALHSTNLDAAFYLAKAEFAGGNLARATELVEQLAKTAANDSAALHLFRGNIYAARQMLPDAASAFEAAIKRDPNLAAAFLNLGMVLRQLGELDGARIALHRATALTPDFSIAWAELGHLHRATGAITDAEQCFERALAIDANVADTWSALGNSYAETFRFPRAKQCFERALALDADNEQARSTLGFVVAEMGETAAAQSILATAPSSLLPPVPPSLPRRVRSLLLLPQIYNSAEDLQIWRKRFCDGLNALCDVSADSEDVWRIAQSNFLLAYQGQNDRDLQEKYAGFLRTLIAQHRPDLLVLQKRDLNRKRIRIVYASSFFRECTVGHYFRSWITDLDAQKFERIVIHTGWQPDAFGSALQRQCDQFIVARGGVLQTAELIRLLAADVVIYPEVGMGTMNYWLTNMRLAPTQIAAWGHPVTTGSREIDYFLTCAAMEPSDAAAHYAERLLMLPGIGTRYALPDATATNITRASLSLSSDNHLYICPQSLFKIHPDNDAIYFDIMVRDAKAVLLFFQSDHAAITKAFADRLAKGMAARGIAPRNQIKFLPRMDSASFRGVLSLANVVLDTLHWSGGNTSLDALSVAAPIVTHPGEFMRGRQTQAMLRAMDASGLIANDHADYVDNAIALASDNVMRESFRQKLIANRAAIFDRSEPVKQLAEHLQRLFESHSQ
jgi:protein O-GlcNAc transferase